MKLCNVKLFRGAFREAAAVLVKALTAVLPEGGLHHAAASVKTPSVVIYGGLISPDITGYDIHTNIFTGKKPCGSRMPCLHCEQAMKEITVEQIVDELVKIVNNRRV